ncbi:hypothetical protein BGZ63DRAFT_420369 [Mariannaea sp. PMI_226]|nr:hypothetical protein BGZ63DRAFT_420369 [Mariannaea sp. PMI_226]
MDDISLLESLHGRLADFDRKVREYRHDLEVDFLRYYHDLLHDVPPSVADEVRRSLANSLPNYPALGLSASLCLDIPPADSRTFARPGSGQRHHSPPTLGSASGSGATGPPPPGSPRDHGHELQGLFTPSYLPLLDSSPPRPPTTPPSAVPGIPPTPDTTRLPVPGIDAEGQGADMDQQGGQRALLDALPVTPELPTRPDHVRRSTDDTTSSVLSDRSEVKTPRSVLRRSSSSSRPSQSPRRVRFDFMGAEVLPTASPQASDFIAPPPVSPTPPLDQASSGSILDDDEEFERSAPPRKISSSEALRALSRAPLDAGTVWTVVNPNSDEIVVEQEEMVTPAPKNQQEPLPAAPDPPAAHQDFEPPLLSPRKLGKVTEEPEEDIDADHSSDDDFLSMAKPKSLANKQASASISPTKAASPSSVNSNTDSKHQTRSINNVKTDDYESEDDDLFHFEGLSAPPRRQSKPLPVEEEEVVEDEEIEATAVSKPSLFATSPAVSILKPFPLLSATAPTVSKFQAGSLGSYKGRPVIMPVVRNPEIHAQAASLGQFNTFVGGLDGRSGMDEGDLNSFRASVANNAVFSGTPRSFTERLMMEEAQLRKKEGSNLSG